MWGRMWVLQALATAGLASMMEPGLATVRFYQKQVGQEAARILLQMLEENRDARGACASGDAGLSRSWSAAPFDDKG